MNKLVSMKEAAESNPVYEIANKKPPKTPIKPDTFNPSSEEVDKQIANRSQANDKQIATNNNCKKSNN
jgi:hypothetical protein